MHGEIVTSQRNLGPLLLRQSNESHAYPSRPFTAMSHFISCESLIVPVYARCFCLDAVLLSTRHSHHDPASDSHTSRMTTLQEEEEEEEKYKDLVSSKVRVSSLTLRKTTVPHTKQKRLKRRAVHNLSAPHPVPPDPNPVLQKISRTKSLSLRNKTLPSPLSSYL